MLGIKPRFTNTELMAIKVLTGIYLKGVNWNTADKADCRKGDIRIYKGKG
jgi:hypothetical protein